MGEGKAHLSRISHAPPVLLLAALLRRSDRGPCSRQGTAPAFCARPRFGRTGVARSPTRRRRLDRLSLRAPMRSRRRGCVPGHVPRPSSESRNSPALPDPAVTTGVRSAATSVGTGRTESPGLLSLLLGHIPQVDRGFLAGRGRGIVSDLHPRKRVRQERGSRGGARRAERGFFGIRPKRVVIEV